VTDLKTIYDRALAACAPDVLVRRIVRSDFPRVVVAIGKCAGALLDGFGQYDEAFAAIPAGYPRPSGPAIVYEGGHPEMTPDSFIAGRALLDFVEKHDAITFLISGGGSACVEWPLDGYTQDQLIDVNAKLIRSGKTIREINAVRRTYSAIKGGRLSAHLKRSVTLVYSDVSRGALADVASGPSIPGSQVESIADNDTLTSFAAAIVHESGMIPVLYPEQLERDVDAEAALLARVPLSKSQVLIAGGEPTVKVHGEGRGGRCSELAVRCALKSDGSRNAHFGSSDGVDGNSGSAGVVVEHPHAIDRKFAEEQLTRSNSMAVIERIGRPIPLRPTGNNLRDLYLLACS
jgi:glycerate-2-kinase